ncbi:MAG: hypothetical protein LBG58_02135, partial [Planctomycetaceae bacterium]|nr:hypothetical protein [Planctomycetaceae bacterium]
CVGDSRLAPVSRWQSVSKPVGNTNGPIESDSLLPSGNATFRRKVAYHRMTNLLNNYGIVKKKIFH